MVTAIKTRNARPSVGDDPHQDDVASAAPTAVEPSAGVKKAKRLLTHRDEDVRVAAVTSLGLAEAEAAVPLLVETFRKSDIAMRQEAIKVLVESPAPEANEAVKRMAHGASEELAHVVINALADNERDGIQRLESFIDTLQPERTVVALDAAAARQGLAAVDYVMTALVAGRWQPWHRSAKNALASLGEPGVSAAVRWLDRHPRDVRTVKSVLLENVSFAAPAAGELLVKLGLSRKHTAVKLLLLQVIRESAAAEQLPTVLEIYRDRRMENIVRVAAFETLSVVTSGDDHRQPIVEALKDADPSIRSLAYNAAGRLGMKLALPFVRSELERTRPESWTPGAVTAFASLGGAEAIGFLGDRYQKTSPKTREAILRIASRSDSPEAVALLTDAVASAHRGTSTVARALLAERR